MHPEARRVVQARPDQKICAVVAQVLLPAGAEPAATTERQERENDVITGRKTAHRRANFHDNARPFVTAAEGKHRDREVAGGYVIIRVAQAGRDHLHENFGRLGIVDIELDAFKLAVRCTQDGRPGFHFDGLSDSPATVYAGTLQREWRRRLRQTRGESPIVGFALASRACPQ